MSERLEARTLAAAVAAVRASTAEHVLLLLPPDTDALEAALLKAALGPLAVERAPARVNAVLVADGADSADAEAAAHFLERARSTTGQLLKVR